MENIFMLLGVFATASWIVSTIFIIILAIQIIRLDVNISNDEENDGDEY